MRNQRAPFYAPTNPASNILLHWSSWKSIAVQSIRKSASGSSNVKFVQRNFIVRRISSNIHLPSMRETIGLAVKSVAKVICWNLDWSGIKHHIKHTHANYAQWHSINGRYFWRTSKRNMQISNWSVTSVIKRSIHDDVWKNTAKSM